jgi:hypothetical protein
MKGRLLDRQAKLLDYLTSGDAIFGRRRDGTLDPALQGIERALLDLEASFSHEKRMEKIAGILPATFTLLGADIERVVRGFADACPPHAISRIENARQFHGFLIAHQHSTSKMPPCCLDVAACELACAEARLRADAVAQPQERSENAPKLAIRRNPRAVLLRTAFDVRAVFEGDPDEAPAKRETCLAITCTSRELRILELTPDVFDVLGALEQWVALGDLPGSEELVADLAAADLLEFLR